MGKPQPHAGSKTAAPAGSMSDKKGHKYSRPAEGSGQGQQLGQNTLTISKCKQQQRWHAVGVVSELVHEKLKTCKQKTTVASIDNHGWHKLE